MTFHYKVYKTPQATVLAVCDRELLGREFREDPVVLRVSATYYGGDVCDEKTLVHLLRDADIISLVGEESISVAVREGLADWRYVKRVQGVPHLNIYRIGPF